MPIYTYTCLDGRDSPYTRRPGVVALIEACMAATAAFSPLRAWHLDSTRTTKFLQWAEYHTMRNASRDDKEASVQLRGLDEAKLKLFQYGDSQSARIVEAITDRQLSRELEAFNFECGMSIRENTYGRIK